MENQLAENIRDHRKRLGLTQELLAERLGITLGTVSKWERGDSEPDLGFIMDLAELVHVSVDALIGFSLRGADADEEAERIEALEAAGAVVTDATCPKVKAIHKIVSRASAEGRFVLILGMKHHPEVEAICGWCGEHLVVENAEELARIWDENDKNWEKPLTLVVQTTQTRSNFTECCDFLKKKMYKFKYS